MSSQLFGPMTAEPSWLHGMGGFYLFAMPGIGSWLANPANLLSLVAASLGIVSALYWGLHVHMRVVRDCRALREQLQEAEKKREAAESANAARSEFLANMSHEMRAPVTGILNFAGLAIKSEPTPAQQDHLDRLLTCAEWLTHVLSDVLDFSRIEAAHVELDKKEFSLSNCILSSVKFVEPEAVKKNLELTCNLAPDLPTLVRGDATRLRQILVNLLDNAILFTTAGSIVLRTAVNADTEETVLVQFSIADTGSGIPHEKQAEIFEPFRGSRRRGLERTACAGLGLSICKRLIQMMDGDIEVQSHVGAGSTFRFTARFDKILIRQRQNEEADALSKLNAKRFSVLIADENNLNRRLTTKLLESAGHQVSPAATAKEALDVYCTDLFDLVLMSTRLPGQGSCEFIRSLRELDYEGTRVPVYALHSENDDISVAELRSAGVDGILAKPVQLDEVLELMQGIAGAHPETQMTR